MNEAFHLSREGTARLTERQSLFGSYACCVLLFATFLGAAAAWSAEKNDERLEEVVIQAKRQAADEQVTQRVQTALSNDPWIFSEHVTVTTRNGVVTVEGIVQDTGEWFRILRLARRIPGARRVVDRLEMLHNDPDGG